MTASDETLVELQSQLAFQEDSLQSLNDTLVRQQQRIDALEQELNLHREKLVELMEAMSERGSATGVVDDRPPHY